MAEFNEGSRETITCINIDENVTASRSLQVAKISTLASSKSFPTPLFINLQGTLHCAKTLSFATTRLRRRDLFLVFQLICSMMIQHTRGSQLICSATGRALSGYQAATLYGHSESTCMRP